MSKFVFPQNISRRMCKAVPSDFRWLAGAQEFCLDGRKRNAFWHVSRVWVRGLTGMPLKFSGNAKIEKGTGDFQVLAFVGNIPVTCVVKRSAVMAGFNELCVSDAQALEIYHARCGEIQAIASQRFDNGEWAPTVTGRDMHIH
jgi:hypothetical protein